PAFHLFESRIFNRLACFYLAHLENQVAFRARNRDGERQFDAAQFSIIAEKYSQPWTNRL
ncbi:MAG TPA: hypothetical protein VHA06_03245, partial [Candidatus Angelobacter sp.]|nr:hypothetical protein [Candidatus Angelobacter sp.]